MTDGVLVIDQKGLIVDCNPAFHRCLGYEKSELIGLSITSLDTPECAARVPEQIAQVMHQGEATFETAYYRKDGSVMMVELKVRYIEVDEKNLFVGILRDITQRHQLERRLKEGLEVYRAAVNTPALGFWSVDLQGRFVEVNDAYVMQSGYSREELLGMGIPDIEAVEKPDVISAHIDRLMCEGHDRFRSKHVRKDGTVWPVEIVTSYSVIQGGRIFVFIEDITERVVQENRLALAVRVYETMEQAVMVTDAENRIISINPAFTRITGYDLSEVLGQNPSIFSSGRHNEVFYAAMWHSLETLGQWEGEIWDRRKDGSVYAKWLSIKTICDFHGNVHQYVSVFSDITERKKTEESIWKQANFDSLTQLPNRYLLNDHLGQEMKKAQRSGCQLAVLFIDLDRFKEVNDSLGHAKGDSLLVQAARRISSCVRDTDTIARLGGDEFTVLLPDFDGRGNLERIVQSLIRDLSEPYYLGNEDLAYVTASIGIALYPDDASDLQDLLKHSDQAMYVAKAEGRNRFSYFTHSMQEEAREKLVLTDDLRRALVGHQLEVYFQPIIDLKSGEIVKAEALLRWHHPERGMVDPMTFIPLAEDSGLIHEIGNWTFGQAVSCIKRWQALYGCTIQVSVNKSPKQLEKSVEPSWSDQLAKLDLAGNSIIVEITEGSLLRKSKRIKQRLIEFRNVGIEVSIDDFGTGFSALSYLHQFDIDYLKIDRSFIADLAENAANTTLIEAIIVMAHKLGIKAIAEGVETQMQRDMLIQFGCDYAQGYLYARALPADEFEQLIDGSQKGFGQAS
jgi:diguanylate cyclase (GGDEF)-like protein/PAS domain S-box-containing protein